MSNNQITIAPGQICLFHYHVFPFLLWPWTRLSFALPISANVWMDILTAVCLTLTVLARKRCSARVTWSTTLTLHTATDNVTS